MTTFAADPFGICFLFGIFALLVSQKNNMLFDIIEDQENMPATDTQFVLSIVVLLLLTTFLFGVTCICDHYAYARQKTRRD